MKTLTITDHYQFAIEPNGKNLRLILLDGSSEWVCHKVTPKALGKFLQGEETHLFKGRLQLNKAGKDVMVSVQGTNIGLISSQVLAEAV